MMVSVLPINNLTIFLLKYHISSNKCPMSLIKGILMDGYMGGWMDGWMDGLELNMFFQQYFSHIMMIEG